MLNYTEMKAALKAAKESTKFFTKEFYQTFLAEKADNLDYYSATGEWLKLKESENSLFYINNGSAWCAMLEINAASQNKYRIDFHEGDYPNYSLCDRRYERFDSEDEARKWAKGFSKAQGYSEHLIEINKIENGEKFIAPAKNIDR